MAKNRALLDQHKSHLVFFFLVPDRTFPKSIDRRFSTSSLLLVVGRRALRLLKLENVSSALIYEIGGCACTLYTRPIFSQLWSFKIRCMVILPRRVFGGNFFFFCIFFTIFQRKFYLQIHSLCMQKQH